MFIDDEHGKPVELVRISLYMLIYGPFHNNIEIPYKDTPFRIIFDAKISHSFETKIDITGLALMMN